jgi:acetoacetyl-CoA synthetase
VLFGVDGCYYGGKTIDCLPTLQRLAAQLPSVENVIVARYADGSALTFADARWHAFEDLLDRTARSSFRQLTFDHPLFILFSSGTTGPPKCIVHGTGGTLLQHLKEHQLHCDMRPGDRVFYYTTTGWMMWNWLLSALASGATLVLYDGAPLSPDPGVLWRLAASERISVFGTSARYLNSLEKTGYVPAEHHELGALRAILSTGSPLAPQSFDYVYRSIARDLQLASIAGGTDLISCFVLGNPMLPVHRGEIQCRGLGMDVRIFDNEGNEIEGQKGELVCASPFPSMPVGFWNDDGSAYRRAYFERFAGIWHHGDFAELTANGGIVMYGRSDATLNPGGVRIGTAEIYRLLEDIPEITDSVVVGQEWDGDTRVVLFVTLASGKVLDADLVTRIKATIRAGASPRHVPARIVAVGDIPRTLNGKTSERAVSDTIHGREVKNRNALANPGALEAFLDLPDLRA